MKRNWGRKTFQPVILCVWEIVQRNCGDRDGREEEEKYGGRNKFLTKQIRVQNVG